MFTSAGSLTSGNASAGGSDGTTAGDESGGDSQATSGGTSESGGNPSGSETSAGTTTGDASSTGEVSGSTGIQTGSTGGDPPPAELDDCFGLDMASCEATSQCLWTSNKDAGSGDCGPDPGYCESLFDADCQNDVECEWTPNAKGGGSCTVVCTELEEAACLVMTTCTWAVTVEGAPPTCS